MKISMVSIPVKDHDKAVAFYTQMLGWRKDVDEQMGDGMRWIEMVLPDDAVRVALFTPTGQEDRVGTFSNVVFSVRDIQKTFDELRKKGVVFIQPPVKQPWGGTTAIFTDAEENSFCICSMEK